MIGLNHLIYISQFHYILYFSLVQFNEFFCIVFFLYISFYILKNFFIHFYEKTFFNFFYNFSSFYDVASLFVHNKWSYIIFISMQIVVIYISRVQFSLEITKKFLSLFLSLTLFDNIWNNSFISFYLI